MTHEALRRFQSDKRLPTEHAQLDDNGDGIGTEELFPTKNDNAPAVKPRPTTKIDGALAKKTYIPLRSLKPSEKTNASPDEGQ